MSDQAPAPHDPVLASDAERERSIEQLRTAVGEGRLTLEEFSERVERAQSARTDVELAALSRDLPAARGAAGVELEAPRERHRAVCSRISRSGPWSLPARSAYSSIFGTIDLDLRQARLSAGNSEIDVFNLFGTVTVIVPDGVEVSVEGGGMFASQVIDSPLTAPVRDAPTLRIHVSGPGGTLYVRNRPPAGTLEKLLGTARAVRELRGGRQRGDS
jgi:DNA-binding transcriptional ArsR family regulator